MEGYVYLAIHLGLVEPLVNIQVQQEVVDILAFVEIFDYLKSFLEVF